jgi:hypothetical protein
MYYPVLEEDNNENTIICFVCTTILFVMIGYGALFM